MNIHDGNVPHSVEAAGPGADGRTERYSVVVYRRDMATEGNQNAFNIEKAKRMYNLKLVQAGSSC